MSSGGIHTPVVRFLSASMIAVGIALVVKAISHGGGVLSVGVVIGLLFIAAGAGRLWLTLRRK